ncbi:hypothetical protein AB5N19_10306 [Seiridium cardinale]
MRTSGANMCTSSPLVIDFLLARVSIKPLVRLERRLDILSHRKTTFSLFKGFLILPIKDGVSSSQYDNVNMFRCSGVSRTKTKQPYTLGHAQVIRAWEHGEEELFKLDRKTLKMSPQVRQSISVSKIFPERPIDQELPAEYAIRFSDGVFYQYKGPWSFVCAHASQVAIFL